MGLKETLRNTVTTIVIGGVSVVCAPDDSGQEAFFTPQRPSATPTPESQVTLPTRTVEPTIVPTPTLAPTPEPIPIPIVVPIPIPTEAPVYIPPAVTIIIEPTPLPASEIAQGPNYEWPPILTAKLNNFRVENGFPSLTTDSRLVAAAQKYAEFFFKARPLTTGTTEDHLLDGAPWDRAAKEGYVGGVLEVIASRSSNPDDMVAAWLVTPPDREAILKDQLFTIPMQHIGAGCYQGPYTWAASGETVRMVVCIVEMAAPYQ